MNETQTLRLKRPSAWFLLSAVLLSIDQWSKAAIVKAFEFGEIKPITAYFNLTRLHNEGAAFGFLNNAGGWQKYFFLGLAVIVSIYVARWIQRLPKENTRMLAAGLAMIIAGALGNAIDRILRGFVVDFLDFYYKSHHWPAFNVADSCILAGAVLVIADVLINGDRPT